MSAAGACVVSSDVVGCEVRGRNAYGRAMTDGSVSCPSAERITCKEQVTFARRVPLYSDACEFAVEVIRTLWENRAELQHV